MLEFDLKKRRKFFFFFLNTFASKWELSLMF